MSLQLAQNGMAYQGDKDFNGNPFTVGWDNPVFYALAPVATAQTQSTQSNALNVKTYNDEVTQSNGSNESVPPPAVIPQQHIVPDYLSDATAANPVGTAAGQPLTQTVPFPAGVLLIPNAPLPEKPSTGLSTEAAEPPAWAFPMMAGIAAIRAKLGA